MPPSPLSMRGAVLALLTVGLSCQSPPPRAASMPHSPPPRAAWTLLVYMAADDDLEQAALANVEEMAEVGSSGAVQVIVQIDRAPASRNGGGFTRTPLLNLPDFSSTKRLRVERGSVTTLADLGETCTGDAEPLASFIAWGLTTFPADKTALVLWDHGAATHGFGWDVTSDNKGITVAEIGAAITDGLARAGKGRLDLIGFDACLMSNLGVAYELRHAADVFVGSEEFEPSIGWAYGPVVRAMAVNALPQDVARAAVTSFADACRAGSAIDMCTLAAFDTTKLDGIVAALDDLGDDLRTRSPYLADWYPIAHARTAAEQYGAGGGEQSPYSTIDAVDFVTGVERAFGRGDGVAAAIESATIASFHGPGRPSAHGLSLTFPRQDKDRTVADDALELATRPGARWDAFLRAYIEVVSADRTPPTMAGLRVARSAGAVDVQGELQGGDLADVAGVVGVLDASGGLTLLSITALATDAQSFHWALSLPKIGDGHDLIPVTVFDEPNAPGQPGRPVHVVSLGGVLYLHGDTALATPVLVYLTTEDGKPPAIVGVYRVAGGGAGSEVTLNRDDRLAPTVGTVAIDGSITRTPSTVTIGLDDPSRLTLTLYPAPPGEYAIGFRLTDYAANRRWEITRVAIP